MLGVSKPVLWRLTQLYIKQGRIHIDDGRIILNKKRNENVVIPEEPEKKEWAESMRIFAAYFPQRRARKLEIRGIVEPLQKEYREIGKEELRFHRYRLRSGNNGSAPVTGEVFGSGNGAVTHHSDESAPTPVTPSEPSNIGTRPTLNSKQETSLVSEWLEQSAARELSHSLTEIEQAVVEAYGAPLQENDPIPGQLLAEARKLDLPAGGLRRWIQDFTKKKQAVGYKITSPTLYVTAAQKDLAIWCRNHADVVYKYQFARDIKERERLAAAEILANGSEDEKPWARQVLGIDLAEGTP